MRNAAPITVQCPKLQLRRDLSHRAKIGLALSHVANFAVGPGRAIRSDRRRRTFCRPAAPGTARTRAEFVAARQIFVPRQQRPILLRIDEGIVLSIQRRHHLSDLRTGLDLLVDLDLDLFCRFGQRLQRQVQRPGFSQLLQECLRRGRIVRLRQVMRNVNG